MTSSGEGQPAVVELETSSEETLSADILYKFDAMGILPVIGVNDPILMDKLHYPTDYGWGTLTLTSVDRNSRSIGQIWRGFRRWCLIPPSPHQSEGGQSIILSDAGDVFLETVTPDFVVYMHRGLDGKVSTRYLPRGA